MTEEEMKMGFTPRRRRTRYHFIKRKTRKQRRKIWRQMKREGAWSIYYPYEPPRPIDPAFEQAMFDGMGQVGIQTGDDRGTLRADVWSKRRHKSGDHYQLTVVYQFES